MRDQTETVGEKTARFTHAVALAGILMNTAAAVEDDIADMRNDLGLMHAIGPIIEPTMYRDFLYSGTHQDNVKLIECVARFCIDLRKAGLIR